MNTIPLRPRSRRRLAAITATLLGLLASSTATATTEPPDDPAVDPAGNEETATSVEQVTLTATYNAGLERPTGQVLARFVEEVEAASGGAIAIELTTDNEGSEQQWSDGDFDIALIRTRTFDTMGVSTFDALSLPFVVQDDDQADRVATSDVADTMLAGLSAIDATGLVLAPVTQEHLMLAGDEPLRTLDQLQTGIRMHAHSDTVAALFEAMGGHVAYDLNGGDWDDAVASGEVLAAEWPTALAGGVGLSMATNFTLFYDFGVIAIRNESLAELSDEQADALRAAGEATLQRQVDERLREEDAFAQACSDGARLTAAPNSLMGEIGLAVDNYVLERLEDPVARELYDAVRQAAGVNKVAYPMECSSSSVTEYEPPDPPSTTFPEGVYRVAGSTPDELYVRGAPLHDAVNNAADYWEFTFDDGHFTIVLVKPDGTMSEEVSVDYSVDERGRITFPDGGAFTWQEVGDGIVTESLPADDPETLWGIREVEAAYGHFHLVKVE